MEIRATSPAVRSPLLAAAITLIACSRPEPPTLKPELAAVTAVTAQGIDLRVQIQAYNPNSIDLSTRSMKASVLLDGKYDVGTVTALTPLDLPAKKWTRIEAPLSVKWKDLTSIAALAAQSRGIPYQVSGTVAIGGETLNVDVPFRLAGTITHEQLVTAIGNSLPGLPLPGLR
ncbi:LEA type 2 family protein [Sorangium atrum]|uniref:LEA type 2 family protein n=1 Tax=Sorangium atrum TaxID=2995308 RepID=A0ABT5CB23_9BACT|nr:LEA type 2 family protein [Sorangium aterium]MDC0682979.1 LEA type 2 family protein [Sorangium aterium]